MSDRRATASAASRSPASRTVRRAAHTAAAGCAVLAGFQTLLAAGAPLGHAAWGGANRRLTPVQRLGSAASVVVWTAGGAVVLGRAGYEVIPASARTLRRAAWAIAGMTATSAALNLASTSPWERRVAAPGALVLAGLVAVVARSEAA